jgi:hypothetical protein
MQNFSPELREGKTLKVFNSLLLRKIFVPKEEEVRDMVRRIMRRFIFCTPNQLLRLQ